jgi:hypothetical protein
MFLVELVATQNNEDMFNVEYIQQCKIKFEPLKHKGIALNVQIAKDIGTPNLLSPQTETHQLCR